MIFKTFNSDIDKLTSKIGVFGKSFNAIFEAKNQRKIDIDDLIMYKGMSLDEAKKQVGNFWSYLYPKKEDIQKQLIDIDKLLPEIDNNKASKILEFIKSIENGTNEEIESLQALYDTGDKTNQWIAEYGQSTKNQIRSTEGVIKANQQARASALAHNEAIKAQSFSAKAGKVALQALAMAGNMIAMWAISKAISFATEKLDEFAHAAENAKEKAKTSKQELDSLTSEINDLNKELEITKDRITELLEKANSGTISLLEEEELNNLREQNDELQREIALKEKLAEIDAREAADNAAYSLTYKTDDNHWDDEYHATDRIDKLQSYVDSANYYQEKISEVNQQILDIEESATDGTYKNDSVYKDLISQQQKYQDGLQKTEELISSVYKELSTEDDSLYYNGKPIEGYEDLINRLDTVYLAVELYLNDGNVENTTEKYIETVKNKLIKSGLSEEIADAVAKGFSEEELNSIMGSESIDWSQCLGLDDATAVIENIKEQLVSVGNTNKNPISLPYVEH